jgi:hypothetical protein
MLNNLSPAEQNEVRVYGVTVAQMREVVKQALARRYLSATEYVLALLEAHICERLNGDHDDALQTLNRAIWVSKNYCVTPQAAA